MDWQLDLTVVAAEAESLKALAETPLVIRTTAEQRAEISQKEPREVLGAFDGWHELVVMLGLYGIPAATLANCLSTWISSALAARQPSPDAPHSHVSVLKLVLQNGDRISEVEISTADTEALTHILSTALAHVDKQ